MYNATRDFNLPLGELHSDASAADITAIWDGERFVYETTGGSSRWYDVAKMFWRYGSSPYYAIKLVNSVVSDFLKLYEAPYFPFRSLTQRTFELGLQRVTAVTGEQFLADNKVSGDAAHEWLVILTGAD